MLRESEFNNSSREIRRKDFRKFALLSVIVITLCSADIEAQTTFTANTSGNWTTVPWIKTGPSAATYPGQPGFESEIHNVFIFGAGITVTLDANITSSVRNVNLNVGTLDISSNTLTMTGNLSGAGTLSFTSGTLNIAGSNVTIGTFNAGTGTVNYNGTGGQTIRGTTYYNLTTSGSGTKVLQAATTINGNLAVSGSSNLQTNQFQITGNATGTFTMASGTNLLIGNTAIATNVSFPANFITSNILLHSNSTVSYQANTSQTVSAEPVYGHLTTATSGAKTLADNITITGNLIIGINTTLDLSINNYNINLGGSWISYGIFNENQGKVIFNGSSTQSIINALTGSETYYDLEFNTGGPVISTCNLAVTNNLSITNGVILMPGKTFLLGTGAANPGTLSHSSGWVYGTFSRWAAPLQNGTDLFFPVGDNNYGRSLTLNFAEITTAGVLSVDFIGTPPTSSGLPLVEDIYIFNFLFPEGYWNLIKDGAFSFNGTYDLSVVPSGFTSYTVDENTRVLSRVSGMDWVLNGTHAAGTPALLRRDDLTTFTNNFAVAYTEVCNSALLNCPGDVVVNNQPGACGNTVSWIPPVISPACVGDIITSNYDPGDFFNAGTHQVVYYLRNGAAIKDSCKFNVIVNDNELPVVLCKDINLYIGLLGTATLNVSDIDNGSSDNCSLLLVPGRSDFTCADAGLTIPVLLTGTDPSGNSASCTARVTVLDTVRPVINTKTFTVLLDTTGNGTLLPSDVNNGTYDNCTLASLSVFPNTFSCSDQGQKTVTFTAQDTYGNTAVSTVQITVQSSLTINSTSLSSCDVAGPYALYESNVSGGDGNYSYFWDGLDDSVDPFISFTATFPFIVFSNTSTAEMPFFNNLMPDGIYTIRLIVTDGNACRDTMDMVITKSGLMFNNITVRYSAACEGSTERYTVNYDPAATYNWGVENGTIITSPLDTSSVEVLWNMGVTQGVIISTAAKTNILGDPCESTVVDTVAINLLPLPVFNNPATEVCFNSVVTYTLTQPFSDYTWIVTGGSITGGGTGSNFVTVRWGAGPAGMIAVSVESGAGCSSAIFINISIFNLAGSLTSLKNITCNGYADGEATVTATAGTGKPPYQYSLDGAPFQALGTFTGLGPGIHNVTIRDDLFCTFNVSFAITQPSLLTATVTKVDVECYGESTGSITAAGSGGTAPLTYSLDGSAYISPGIFNSLPAGPHSLIVRDANLCTFTQNINITQPPALTGSASVTTAIPCNGGTATVTLTGGGGTAPLSYTFNSITNATGIFSGIPAGNGYAWSITDANSCGPVTGTLDVTEPAIITGLASVTTAILCNGGTAIVTMTGSGGTAPLSYTFNGVTNATGLFIGIPAGTGYAWSITDVNSCAPVTGTLDVTEPSIITGSASVTTPVLCNGGTATITMIGGGGTPPLSYTFNGNTNSTGIFSDIPAGTGYIWSITDANSCGLLTGLLDVTEPALLTGSASVTTAIICNGGTATVTLTGSSGTPPISYTFNGVTNATGIFSGIPAGTGYAWSITDANSCGPVTGTLDVTEPVLLTGSASVTSPIACNGGTADVTITGSGGTAPLSYTFNGVSNATGIFSGISAGNGYAWSITDANLCGPVTGTLDVTEPAILTGSASFTTAIACNGGTATVTLTGGGGTAPLSYTFNGVTNATGIFSGIPAGTGYAWNITDASLCTPATGTLDVTEPTAITGSASVTTPIPCNGGTATITITGSGGIIPLSFTFNGVTNATGIFSGIPAGTGYAWSITDANLCGPLTATLDVTEPGAITGSASVTTAIACNGGTSTVTVTGIGGTAPLSYTFNGVTNGTGVFAGIPAGMAYAWSITDANLCGPLTGTIDVTEPSAIAGSASVTTAIACNGGTATVTVTGGGGTAPLSYTFNGVTNGTGVFAGIPAGMAYAWSITDANLCGPLTGTLDATEPGAMTGSASVTTAIPCNGGTATVTVTGSGGTAPLSYTFNGVTNGTGVFAGIPAGVAYAWSITDANLCGPLTGTLDVTEPTVLSGIITSQINVSTYGGNDGSVTVDGSDGSAPYQYRLDAGLYQASGTFNTLIAGSYTVTVQDINLCTFVVPVTITQPAGPLEGTITSQNNVLCFGGNTGNVTVTGVEGITPYEYRLNAGPYQVSGTFGSLTAGIYTVTVRDALLATYDVPVTITEPSVLSVTTPQVDVLCFGSSTGSATAIPAGGVGPYNYSWNTLPVQTTATASGLPAAMYTVTVIDANSCTATASVTLTQPATALAVTTAQVNISCSGSSDGSASATGSGGTEPYTYSWNTSPVQTTAAVSGLDAGTYTVTVTDFAGCTITGTVTITEPQALSVEGISGNARCPDTNEGSINLTITGGTSPYNIIWSDGNTNSSRTGLLPGTYSVVVTDQNGCPASLNIPVDFDGTFGCVSIPQVITPNGDGKNDTWIIRNIDMYPDAEILVFTRWGKLIFRTKNPLTNQWDGTFNNGRLVPTDSYHYILYLNDGSEPRSGIISVIR
ncbi:MAG: gliding motility-associated C-terminal domain-containing protein [Bacteroidales bacterium]|nr:gliding motility-associated C-terminal domain-containing protein [Bacteroidales bacterium]